MVCEIHLKKAVTKKIIIGSAISKMVKWQVTPSDAPTATIIWQTPWTNVPLWELWVPGRRL